MVQLIWFGFAYLKSFHCPLVYSLTSGTLGTDALAQSWLWGLHEYAFPPASLLAQTVCKIGENEEQVLLVAPYRPTRTRSFFLRGRAQYDTRIQIHCKA